MDGNVFVTNDFLALDRPMRIGVTSGASTPDSVVQECIEAVALVKKLAPLEDASEEGGVDHAIVPRVQGSRGEGDR